jgi:DNA repair photolyase
MRAVKIPTVVWISPILPFINDTKENLQGLLDYCIKAEVRGIFCFGFGVTLREGNREYFYTKLDEQFPGLKQKYIQQFGNTYACSSPNSKQLKSIFQAKCQQHRILYKTEDVFAYLQKFESKERQTTLF